MLMAAAICVARCSISALCETETNLTDAWLVGLQAFFDNRRARFFRIAAERFPRGVSLFLRRKREERLIEESLQAGKRHRIAELAEGPDALHAERAAPSEKVDALQNPQQRLHSFLHHRASNQ